MVDSVRMPNRNLALACSRMLSHARMACPYLFMHACSLALACMLAWLVIPIADYPEESGTTIKKFCMHLEILHMFIWQEKKRKKHVFSSRL